MYASRFPSATPSWSDLEHFADQVQRAMLPVLTAARHGGPSALPVNVWADDATVAITAEVPGASADQVNLSLEGDGLTIEVKPGAPTAREGSWLRRERPRDTAVRTITLPFRVDADQVEARVTDGVLTVALRRLAADRPRRITVNAA